MSVSFRAIAMTATLLWSAACASAEQVTVERDTQLRNEPSYFASTGTTLKQGTRAELIEKRGVWINIKAAEGSGWAFVFNVRYGERQGGSAQGDISAAGRMVSARPVTSVTSTIGVRGLSEEDLKNASYNAAQMQMLDSYAASKEQAQQQAQASALQPVQVDYFGAAK